jgi:phosphate starvation-inducible PhoH-like protein
MSEPWVTERISLAGIDAGLLFGPQDSNLKAIEQGFPIKIIARGDEVIIKGYRPEVERVVRLFLNLRSQIESGENVDAKDVAFEVEVARGEAKPKLSGEEQRKDELKLSALKKLVKPKSETQRRYLLEMQNTDIVVAIGPAGTGKTYLAVAAAISALNQRQVDRIVLARPAVEAGESLGFLPGDLQEKVNPYLRPLYDALYELMAPEKVRRLVEVGIIEIAPLAYMRGRTLNDSFIIVDEAQNTTSMQMKMILTRMGFNSKMVITGDITQIDLPKATASGLVEIQGFLSMIMGIKFVYFSEKDVVRHHLVQEIIKAYEVHESDKENGNG